MSLANLIWCWNKALVEKIGLALVGGAPTLVIFRTPCFGMNCSMNRKPCGCIGKSRQTGDGRNQFSHFLHDLSSSFSQSNCCHDPAFSDTVAASQVAGFFQCDWQWWVIHRIQQMLRGYDCPTANHSFFCQQSSNHLISRACDQARSGYIISGTGTLPHQNLALTTWWLLIA